LNGSLTVHGGTVIYTPNQGFAGKDTFLLETCNVSGECSTVVVEIQVEACQSTLCEENAKSDDSGPSKALYALLAIPFLAPIIGVFVFRKKIGDLCAKGDRKDNTLMERRTSLSSRPDHTSNSEEVARTESFGQPYLSRNKDQVLTVLRNTGPLEDEEVISRPPQQIEARVPNDSEQVQTVVGQSQDPPVAQAVDLHANNNQGGGYLPQLKDQCRSVANPDPDSDPPIVNAVFVEPMDVHKAEQ
jgi:hypothetical protein